jgi:hypothetical protein
MHTLAHAKFQIVLDRWKTPAGDHLQHVIQNIFRKWYHFVEEDAKLQFAQG